MASASPMVTSYVPKCISTLVTRRPTRPFSQSWRPTKQTSSVISRRAATEGAVGGTACLSNRGLHGWLDRRLVGQAGGPPPLGGRSVAPIQAHLWPSAAVAGQTHGTLNSLVMDLSSCAASISDNVRAEEPAVVAVGFARGILPDPAGKGRTPENSVQRPFSAEAARTPTPSCRSNKFGSRRVWQWTEPREWQHCSACRRPVLRDNTSLRAIAWCPAGAGSRSGTPSGRPVLAPCRSWRVAAPPRFLVEGSQTSSSP